MQRLRNFAFFIEIDHYTCKTHLMITSKDIDSERVRKFINKLGYFPDKEQNG